MDLLTLCQIKPKKFLGLEIFGYLILQDLLITSPNFSYLKIEVLFQTCDKIFKIEALGLSSRLVCWKLWQNVEFQQSWHLESSNEQTFSPLLITFQNLVPIAIRVQHEFFE